MRMFMEMLRKAFLYPFRLLFTFGPWSALSFVLAYRRGDETISLKPRGVSRPVWMRPRASDIRVVYEIFTKRELAFPWPYPQPPRRVIDAGANVGYATLAIKERWPECEIVALEPDDSNFEVLARNCENMSGVTLLKRGLWSESRSLKLEAHSRNMGAWALKFEPCEPLDPDAVHAVSIPDLLDEMAWEDCDFLKMDIEGAEMPIFRRSCEWLPRAGSVLVEAHGAEALKLVKQAGQGMKIRQEGEKFLLWR